MDPFDDSILKLFRDGKPREFQQILAEVEFSHNTLRIHLDKLAERGLINKNRQPAKGPGGLESSTRPPSAP